MSERSYKIIWNIILYHMAGIVRLSYMRQPRQNAFSGVALSHFGAPFKSSFTIPVHGGNDVMRQA